MRHMSSSQEANEVLVNFLFYVAFFQIGAVQYTSTGDECTSGGAGHIILRVRVMSQLT